MTTETATRPSTGASGKPLSWAVRAQHDGVSHYLVREPQLSADGQETIVLGIHTATCCDADGAGGWLPGCAHNATEWGSTPDHDMQILRFSSQERAQQVADRANLNSAGYVWYAIPHEWEPPAGYVPPVNADSLAELEQQNLALRQQIALAENERLQAQLSAARTPELAAPATEPATPAESATPWSAPPN